MDSLNYQSQSLGPNDVQQAHDIDAEYQKELVEEVGYGVDGGKTELYYVQSVSTCLFCVAFSILWGRPLGHFCL